MNELTLDDAIKHCLEVAEQKEHDSITTTGDYELDIAMKEGCIQCAADHRQLAEWLIELKEMRKFNDKIYDVLAKQFGSPCNCNYAVDAYMRKNGGCDDCSIKIPAKECWSRYIQTKLIGDKPNGI